MLRAQELAFAIVCLWTCDRALLKRSVGLAKDHSIHDWLEGIMFVLVPACIFNQDVYSWPMECLCCCGCHVPGRPYFLSTDILYFLILTLPRSWKYPDHESTLKRRGSGAWDPLGQRCTIFKVDSNKQGNNVPHLIFPNDASRDASHLVLVTYDILVQWKLTMRWQVNPLKLSRATHLI